MFFFLFKQIKKKIQIHSKIPLTMRKKRKNPLLMAVNIFNQDALVDHNDIVARSLLFK